MSALRLCLALAAAVLIGVTLGLLGGGSILTVPILVYIAGVPAKEAIAMSLFVVGVTAEVVVCRSGLRSARAARLLARYRHEVYNLGGGMRAWAGARLPVKVAGGACGAR